MTRAESLKRMTISIRCPECGKRLKVKEHVLGKQIKCPACGKSIQAPAAEDDEPQGIVMSRPGMSDQMFTALFGGFFLIVGASLLAVVAITQHGQERLVCWQMVLALVGLGCVAIGGKAYWDMLVGDGTRYVVFWRCPHCKGTINENEVPDETGVNFACPYCNRLIRT